MTTNKSSLLLLIIILLCSLELINTKIYTNSYTISQLRRSKGWLFIDRMSFDTGLGSFNFSIKLQTQTPTQKQQIQLQLAIVPQQKWNQQQLLQCNQKRDDHSDLFVHLHLRKDRDYTDSSYHHLQIKKPLTYHFVLRDCDKMLSNQYLRKESRLLITLQLKNNQYQHGADQHINKIMLPLLIAITGVMVYFSRGPKHNDAGQYRDWAKLILHITLYLNLAAIVFYYVGFMCYLWWGKFHGFFDFMYLFFHSISQSVLTSLLIFIAYGWTITFTKDAEFDLYIPLVSMLGLINLVLTMLGKINDGDHDKYHMYDTIPSYMLVFFRICTLLVFIIGIIKLYRDCKGNKHIVGFLANYGFMGGIYFLSLPAIMLLAVILPVSARKQIVFFSVQLIKNIVNLILTWMISSKKSKYKNLQHGGQSFFQRDNKLL